MAGPLAGLKVLDFSTLLPGPLATLMLAEAGAEVLKIERPGGDDMRHFPPRHGRSSAPFMALNGGKRSEILDLKRPDDIVRAHQFASESDVLIEQFRPGVMQRLGLGYEALSAINPRLIYCSITGFGQTGPRALQAGHDLNYQALSGLLAQGLRCGAKAPLPPALIADIAGGAYPAVINILLALRQRDASGLGCHLDVSMADGATSFTWFAEVHRIATGSAPDGGANLLNGGSPRYQIYGTADGWFLAVGALEDKFWAAFCDAAELPQGVRSGDVAGEAGIAIVRAVIGSRDAPYWRGLLEPLDCCCTVVRTLDEANPAQSGPFATDASGASMPVMTIPISAQFRKGPEAVRLVPTLNSGTASGPGA